MWKLPFYAFCCTELVENAFILATKKKKKKKKETLCKFGLSIVVSTEQLKK